MAIRYWLAKSDKKTPRKLERTPWSVTENLIDKSEYALSYSSPAVVERSFNEYRLAAIKDHKSHSRCTRVLKGIWEVAKEVKPGDRFILIERGNVVALGISKTPESYTCEKQGQKNGYNYRLHKIKVQWTPFRGKVPSVSAPNSPLNTKGYQSIPIIEVSDNERLLAAVGFGSGNPITTIVYPEIQRTKTIVRTKLIKDDDSDPYRNEGGLQDRFHRTIERCSKAAEDAKEQIRKTKGAIACEACGVITAEDYGSEIIDAHHIVPLAELNGKPVTPKIKDFSMLCPTCHRAVHKVLRKKTHSGKDAIKAVSKSLRSNR